jgi:hypothetical protein
MSGSHEPMPAQDAPRFTPDTDADTDAAAVPPAQPAPGPATSGIAQPSGPKVPLPRPALRPRGAPAHAQIPLPAPNVADHDMKPPGSPDKRIMARARPPVPKTSVRTLRASDVGAGAQWPRLQ